MANHPVLTKVLCVALVASIMLPLGRMIFPFVDTVVSGLVFCSVPDPLAGLVEVKRVLGADGRLRVLEHVRARWRWRARWQDLIQPAWVCLIGGCHSNRDTERSVMQAGFEIEREDHAAVDNFRRFSARPR